MSVPNIVSQRQNVASNAVIAATKLLDAINALVALKAQRAAFESDFADSDFDGTSLQQLSAGLIGTLFDFVVPAFTTTLADAGNSGRNNQVLNQVRQ
jgi:hypothetical protein